MTRHTMGAILAMLTFPLAPADLVAQRDFSEVEMLEGSGGNIGVSVGEDGVLMVDDQFAPLAGRIRKAIGDLGGESPTFVLNTHWHGDHTGGNAEFGREATILAHANVRKRLLTRSEMRGRVHEPQPKEALPVITFEDRVSVHFNGEEIRAVHAPHAHTDGDTVLHFTGSNVVHMGDTFFSGRFPFVDLESGGSVTGLERLIAELVPSLAKDVRIIPGHGPLSGIRELREYREMLHESIGIVRKGVAAGKSADELVAEGLPARWKGYGEAWITEERWIRTIHEDLSGR
jgi:cyclase